MVMDISSVSVEQMKQVDRVAVEDFGLQILMMMENASIYTASLAQRMLNNTVKNKKILILAHKGNNGGDGLGAARHLANKGAEITVVLTCTPNELTSEGMNQYRILHRSGIPIIELDTLNMSTVKTLISTSDLIVDALLGNNIKGAPRSPIDLIISAINSSPVQTLSIDIPSGLDGDTGLPHRPTVKATATLTLAMPKKGLLLLSAQKYIGELWVADLSIPQSVYQKLNIAANNVFEENSLYKIQL